MLATIFGKLLALLGLTTPAELLALALQFGVYVAAIILGFLAFVLRDSSHGVHLFVVAFVFVFGTGFWAGVNAPKITL